MANFRSMKRKIRDKERAIAHRKFLERARQWASSRSMRSRAQLALTHQNKMRREKQLRLRAWAENMEKVAKEFPGSPSEQDQVVRLTGRIAADFIEQQVQQGLA